MTVEVFQKQVNEIIQDGTIVPIESLLFDKPYWIGVSIVHTRLLVRGCFDAYQGFGLMC